MTQALDNYLLTYRKQAGLSQREAALVLGYQTGTPLSRHESGVRVPHLDTALAYSALYGAPVQELFRGRYRQAERRVMDGLRRLRRSTDKASPKTDQASKPGPPPDLPFPTPSPEPPPRILALSLHQKGVGYATFEGPERLIDWGVARIPSDKRMTLRPRVLMLATRYRPDVLVVEETNDPASRRAEQTKRSLTSLIKLVRSRGIDVSRLSQRQVTEAFRASRAETRYQIATILAARYPALGQRLPPNRKPWMTEDPRMAIFHAVALGVGYYHDKGWRPSPAARS